MVLVHIGFPLAPVKTPRMTSKASRSLRAERIALLALSHAAAMFCITIPALLEAAD